MKIVFAFIFLMATHSLALAGPDKWDTLPDGRVVIEVYGQRLAFDPNDPNIDWLAGFGDGGSSFPPPSMSLERVLKDRLAAEAFFEQNKLRNLTHTYGIVMGINFSPRPPIDSSKHPFEGKFQGKFPFDDIDGRLPCRFVIYFAKPGESGRQILYSNRNPNALNPPFDLKSGPDELGMTIFKTTRLISGKYPDDTTIYILPAARRLTPAQVDQRIGSDSFHGNAMGFTTEDGMIDFDYRWSAGYEGNPADDPFLAHFSRMRKHDFYRLDDIMRHVAAYIFIDRKPEDFQ